MKTSSNVVKKNFRTIVSVVDDDYTASADANQILMAFAMRVLAAGLATRNAVNHEITFWQKGNVSSEFANRQIPARIDDNGMPLQRNAFDAYLGCALSYIGYIAGSVWYALRHGCQSIRLSVMRVHHLQGTCQYLHE